MSIAVPLYGFGASGGSPNKSTIIVTAPTGSTVTCKMGSTTKTAAEKNGVWTFGGLDLGTWTITSTKGGDSATQDVVITRLTVEYVTIVYRITPEFTYTGDYAIVDDSDNPISDFANWKGNWKIRFLTSGTLTFTNLNGAEDGIDVFLVGGGASGGGRGGGGGGYTKTQKSVSVKVGIEYPIIVGAGGVGPTTSNRVPPNAGGTTSAFGLTANGGDTSTNGDYPSSGGSGGGSGVVGGAGYSGGSDGSSGGGGDGGSGQGTTTREFEEANGTLYAGGGGGGAITTNETSSGGAGGGGDGGGVGADPRPKNGDANTGGGGGGLGNLDSSATYASGGSGIVIIRNTRGAA